MSFTYLNGVEPAEPGAHVLYRCYDKHGALLYIGMTNDVENRLRQHKQSAVWSSQLHLCVFDDSFTSRHAAAEAEAAAIKAEEPLYNRAHCMGAGAAEIDYTRSQLVAAYLDQIVGGAA